MKFSKPLGGNYKYSSFQAKDDPLADIRKHLGCDGVRKYMREDKSKKNKMAEENGIRGRDVGKLSLNCLEWNSRNFLQITQLVIPANSFQIAFLLKIRAIICCTDLIGYKYTPGTREKCHF